jgi:hypothetical protein
MNNLKSYLLATVGIVSLVASLTLNIVRANNTEASTVAASTGHFNPGRTYLFSPANGTGNTKAEHRSARLLFAKTVFQIDWH